MHKNFYPHLEGLRGYAVFFVLISHWLIISYFPQLIFLKLGFLGVNIFFVLSGFLITEILLNEINYNCENRSTILKKILFKKRITNLSHLLSYDCCIGIAQNQRK